jgi:S1-C subfamily serine protease
VKALVVLLACLFGLGCAGSPAQYNPPRNTAAYFDWLASGTVQVYADCGEGRGSGSGVVVGRDPSGLTYIATAQHVAEDADCTFDVNGEPFVYVVSDETYDSAIIAGLLGGRVTAESEDIYLGQPITVIGYPSQPLTGKTAKQVTAGVVSSFVHETRLKISAQAYFGNSGGPVFDEKGRLVGLVVSLVQRGGVPLPGEIFVTPARRVYELLEEAREAFH